MISKKAQLTETLKKMLIFLLVALAIFIVFFSIYNVVKARNTEQTCSLSILAAAKFNEKSEGLFATDIKCPVRVEEIKFNDYKRGNNVDDLKLKAMLAQELVDCYSKTHKGELDPYNLGKIASVVSVCLTCSRLEFDDDFIKEAGKIGYKIKGFNYYLATRRLPQTEQTYYEFFTGKPISPELLEKVQELGETDVIDISSLADDGSLYIVWRQQALRGFFPVTFGAEKLIPDMSVGAVLYPSKLKAFFPPVSISKLSKSGDQLLPYMNIYGIGPMTMFSEERIQGDDAKFCDILVNQPKAES